MRRFPIIALTLALTLSCDGAGDTPRSPSAIDLLPVALPDVSGMHAAVQDQLRVAHDEVSARPSDGDPERLSQAYGGLGVLLMAGEYFDAAEPCLVNAQQLAPEEHRWPYYLGHVAREQGDLERAAESFARALDLRPSDLATLVSLTSTYLDLGRPEAAAPVIARARSVRPDAQVVRFLQGQVALAQQDYAEAVDHLEDALALDPGATIIHYPLAMAYRGLGDLEQAETHFQRSGGRAGNSFIAGVMMDLDDPLMAEVDTALRSPEGYRDLALRADANGDVQEAARLFREAVRMAPDDPVMRLSLGMALERAGDAPAARTELEEAVRLDPGSAQAHYILATILERAGRDAAAIDEYRAAVASDSSSVEASLRLADALRRTDRLEESLTHYRRVAELAPDQREARFGEAMALVRLGRHREARERLSLALDRFPGDPAFANALARLLAASPDAAVRDGQRAFALVQAVVDVERTTAVAETMAMALAELGQYAGAVEWQQMAIEVAQDAGRPDIAEQMSSNLTRYRRREPARTPWRNDEPEHRPGPVVDPELLGPSR